MKNENTHIAYGLVTGIVLVIISLTLHLTGAIYSDKTRWVAWMADVPFLVGIILNGMAFAKAKENYVTFGNIYWSCFRMSIIVALLMVFWAIIELIFMPEIKEKAMQMAAETLQKKNLPEDQVETGMAMGKKFYAIGLLIGTIFGTLLTGAVCSLIGALIPKKKGERPFQLDTLK